MIGWKHRDSLPWRPHAWDKKWRAPRQPPGLVWRHSPAVQTCPAVAWRDFLSSSGNKYWEATHNWSPIVHQPPPFREKKAKLLGEKLFLDRTHFSDKCESRSLLQFGEPTKENCSRDTGCIDHWLISVDASLYSAGYLLLETACSGQTESLAGAVFKVLNCLLSAIVKCSPFNCSSVYRS